MFSFSTPTACLEKGDEMRLAAMPHLHIARQLLLQPILEPAVSWDRVVFRSGAHRWAAAKQVPQVAPGLIVEWLQTFDEALEVGEVVVIREWDATSEVDKCPAIALARLCSVRHGEIHERQTYSVQHFQTLNLFGGPRG